MKKLKKILLINWLYFSKQLIEVEAINFLTGANGLPCLVPLGEPGKILSGGITLPINIFVGSEVACTMYAFYALFRRGGL